MNNPYLENNKWFWYDEAYDIYGPYETFELAKKDFDNYCKYELLI